MSQENPHAGSENQHDPEQQDQENMQNNPEDELDYNAFADEAQSTQAEEPNTVKPEINTDPSEDEVRISILQDELDRTKDLMMRAVAEAENGRKRALKEREDASKFAISSFSRDLLTVADNLRRALDAVPADDLNQNEQFKNFVEGLEATERELLNCFEKNGIKKTEPLDEILRPEFP